MLRAPGAARRELEPRARRRLVARRAALNHGLGAQNNLIVRVRFLKTTALKNAQIRRLTGCTISSRAKNSLIGVSSIELRSV